MSGSDFGIFLPDSRAIYERCREDLGGCHLLKTPSSELKSQTPGINSIQKVYSRLTIWVWLVKSPVLDTKNNRSIVLNEQKLTGLRLFPSSKGDTVINGIGTDEGA